MGLGVSQKSARVRSIECDSFPHSVEMARSVAQFEGQTDSPAEDEQPSEQEPLIV
jgi:hypothetical protein